MEKFRGNLSNKGKEFRAVEGAMAVSLGQSNKLWWGRALREGLSAFPGVFRLLCFNKPPKGRNSLDAG